MKSILLVFLFSFCLTTKQAEDATDWPTLVNNTSIIMAVDVKAGGQLRFVERWKGDIRSNDVRNANEGAFELLADESYLIFADTDKHDANKVNLIAQPLILNEVPAELRSVLDELPCYLETETAAYKKKTDPSVTGACHRIDVPVCGCNGVTYDNACVALTHGIMKFTKGECLKEKLSK